MNLAKTLIAWNPVRPDIPAAERGRLVLLRWPRDEAEGSSYRYQAGAPDVEAQEDPTPVERYIQNLARIMVERDSLLPSIVRSRLLQIEGVTAVFETDVPAWSARRDVTAPQRQSETTSA
jgi:hypothetical protein